MRLFSSSCVSAIALAVASTAHAQTAAPVASAPAVGDAPDGQADASAAPSGDRGGAGDIVVTGSRIARRDYTSESPIVTASQDLLSSTGSPTLEQGLNQLPQITASAGSSASFTSRAGQANVNLRGLGQQRTLVLVNGRRMQPSGSDGSVDLNVIPTALIDNVEVITGGASSTYGSDAVAGVVNLKLKRRFTGLQLDGTAGETFRGDGSNNSITGTAGVDLGGRGNAYLSLSYSDRGSADFLSRDYLRGQALSSNLLFGNITLAANNLPTQAAYNAVFAKYGVASTVSRSSVLSINPDQTLFVSTGAINYRGQTTSPIVPYGGNIYSSAGDYFFSQVPLQRFNALAHADHELSDTLSVFADGLFTHYTATTQGNPITLGATNSAGITIPVTNPFIPADLRAVLASRPNPAVPFAFQQNVAGLPPRQERDTYDVYQVTAGLDGKIGGGAITWELYGQHGRTKLDQQEVNYFSSYAVQTLLNAADGGATICQGGYNFADIRSLSAACIQYISRDAHSLTTIDQTVVEANAQGGLFNLPAGSLRFAAGADYRRNAYSFTPDPLIRSGELANTLPILPSTGSDDVKEVYGELLVPVLRDSFIARELNLDLGYRYSNYRVSGGVSTYKADADWSLTRWARLRGGYARAVRAPSVGELFSASSQSAVALGAPGPLGSGDPCDVRSAYRTGANAAQVRTLCLAQGVPSNLVDTFQNLVSRTPFTTSGNTALRPETSDTFSAGVVFRSTANSPLFSRLTFSVDYYNIKLKDAIGSVTSSIATSQCFSPTVNPSFSNTNFYCALITRETTAGQISNVLNPLLNLGGYQTSGIDVAADWTVPLDQLGLGGGAGRTKLSTVVSYLDSFRIRTLPGGDELDYAGTLGNQQVDFFATAKPRWKATSSAGWENDTFSATFRWRYIGPMANARNVGTTGTLHGVPAVSYFDLDLATRVGKDYELRLGLVNLLDRKPPTLNDSLVGNYATDPYAYDLIGRRFFVSVRAKLR